MYPPVGSCIPRGAVHPPDPRVCASPRWAVHPPRGALHPPLRCRASPRGSLHPPRRSLHTPRGRCTAVSRQSLSRFLPNLFGALCLRGCHPLAQRSGRPAVPQPWRNINEGRWRGWGGMAAPLRGGDAARMMDFLRSLLVSAGRPVVGHGEGVPGALPRCAPSLGPPAELSFWVLISQETFKVGT